MTRDRFSFFDGSEDDAILRRSHEIEIRLFRFTEDKEEGSPAGIAGSFKISGDLGTLDELASAADMAFMRKLLERFEQVEK